MTSISPDIWVYKSREIKRNIGIFALRNSGGSEFSFYRAMRLVNWVARDIESQVEEDVVFLPNPIVLTLTKD